MDDRLLTSKEFKEFEESWEKQEDRKHWDNLSALLGVTSQRLNQQLMYTRILESILETRSEKLADLEVMLNSLEKELIELRCLVKTTK